MLAALRSCLPEFARGLSTALAIRASPRCPDCSPSLSCPDIGQCPACTCNGALRAAIEEPCAPCGLLYYSVSDLLVAIGIGVVIGYWVRGALTVCGQPIIQEHRAEPIQIRQPEAIKAVFPSAASKALARSPAVLDSNSQ